MAKRPNYCFSSNWRDLREGDRVIIGWPSLGKVDTEYRELYRFAADHPWLFVKIDGRDEYVVRNDGQFAYIPDTVVVAHQPVDGYHPEVNDAVVVHDLGHGDFKGVVTDVTSDHVAVTGPRDNGRYWIWKIDIEKIDQYLTKRG